MFQRCKKRNEKKNIKIKKQQEHKIFEATVGDTNFIISRPIGSSSSRVVAKTPVLKPLND